MERPAAAAPAAGASHSTRVNNFDLIRLFAALQVVVVHAMTHLKATALDALDEPLSYIPGVPIFFVISGYLISLSWERAPSARQYLWNRVLRIYPALWACLAFSIAVFLVGGVRPPLGEFLVWVAAQATFVQFYNPDFLRSFGVGVINGSLWTISVELQFYLTLPILAVVAGRRRWVWVLIAAAALAMMLPAHAFVGDQETFRQKLLGVTLVPYLFYFMVGILARLVHQRRPVVFEGKGLYWAGAYLAWIWIERQFGVPYATGNLLNPVTIILVGLATVSLAFTARGLSGRVLNGNDISYGVYIYHMPVVNALLVAGITGVGGFLVAVAATIVLSTASWLFVERPALGLKAYSVRW